MGGALGGVSVDRILCGWQSDKAKEKKGAARAVAEVDQQEDVVAAAVPAREEAPTLPSAAEEGEGTAAAEITSMLRAKKRKRREREAEERGKEYVAFDALDWRSKQLG